MPALIKILAINLAMRKPAPDSIPISNMERVRKRDYFVVTLGPENDRNKFLIRQLTDDGFSGLWFEGAGSRSTERNISYSELHNLNVLITHYFRTVEIRYYSPTEFVFKYLLGYQYTAYARAELGRYLFNLRSLDEKRRIHVLRVLLDSEINNNPVRSVLSLMSELYGVNWMQHRRHGQLYTYYEMMLESLIISGDVRRNANRTIEITPQAINTIDAFAEEERRHNGIVVGQRWMLWVTIAVCIATAFQAYRSWYPASTPVSQKIENNYNHFEIEKPVHKDDDFFIFTDHD